MIDMNNHGNPILRMQKEKKSKKNEAHFLGVNLEGQT